MRLLLPCLAAACLAHAAEPARLELTGDWRITVAVAGPRPLSATVSVRPPDIVNVTGERHDKLPDFDAKAAPWRRGARLRGVIAEECTVQGLLDPDSLVVRASASGAPLQKGVDFDADLAAGTLGRLPAGSLAPDQPVLLDYRHGMQRIDSIVLSAGGVISVRAGAPHAATPAIPALAAGEARLANVHISGRLDRLGPDNLFPVLESAYPEPPRDRARAAESLLPRTFAKLVSGEPLRILAWGDSVTTFERYQVMFVMQLRERFPRARIELVTEAWGGRSTASYLKEPPGSPHNYEEKVLGRKADLVISEFVNDAGLKEAQVDERYGKLLADFRKSGAEWIILTPHYVRPDWMGLTRQREIDDDPRPYVKGLRTFAAKHGVALADAAARYGRLWRQGIPYLTLMDNNINHPNVAGHAVFADSLMALFPGGSTALFQ